MEKKFVVKCPHCGAEYLLEEILLGSDLLSNRNAIKDSSGNIIHIDGDDPEMCSEYICDFCDKKFKVEVMLDAHTISNEDLWDEEYSVEIFKDRIELEE